MARAITYRLDLCNAKRHQKMIELLVTEAIELHKGRPEAILPETADTADMSVIITDDIDKAVAATEDIVFFLSNNPQEVSPSRIKAMKWGQVGDKLVEALAKSCEDIAPAEHHAPP